MSEHAVSEYVGGSWVHRFLEECIDLDLIREEMWFSTKLKNETFGIPLKALEKRGKKKQLNTESEIRGSHVCDGESVNPSTMHM